MLTSALSMFVENNPLKVAFVSDDLPLISNQEVYLNIALIKQYHENMNKEEARQLAIDVLKRINLEHIAFKRNPALSPDDRFFVMLLRAAMMKDSIIVLDRPFQIVPHWKTAQSIANVLKKIDDLYSSCHIYDYSWMKEKYGDLCL